MTCDQPQIPNRSRSAGQNADICCMPARAPVFAEVTQLRLGDRFRHQGRTWRVDHVVKDPDIPAVVFVRTVEGATPSFTDLDIVWLAD